MASEPKLAEATESANKNASAEQDVQNILAELKADAAPAAEKPDAPEEKKEDTHANGNKDTSDKADADAEAKEEERIVAAAAKLGQEDRSKDSGSRTGGHRPSRGGNRGGKRTNYRDNVKTDFSSLKETSDPVEIRKQVEFYFSDSNLPMDKFLLSKVGGHENRPVDLSLLHSFQRMRRFQPFSAVVDALKDSATLELTDNDTCVRRKVPLPETITDAPDATVVKVFEDEAMQRSVYAKGFGPEEPSTQFDIEAFFTPYGPLNAVRLRRTQDKTFKGSVFVEFDSEETQKKFLALDPKPKWKGTTELLIKSKKEYCDDKVKDIEAGKIKAKDSREPRFNKRGRGGHRGRGRDDRGRDDRDWRDRRADDQKKGFRSGRRDRSGERQAKPVEKDSRGVPVVQVTKSPSKSPESASKGGQKRAREDQATKDGADGADRPAKKVDVKDG